MFQWGGLQSAEVTRRTSWIPAPEPWHILGEESLQNYPARDWVTCLRCKEHGIVCQGLDARIGGHCSHCHEDGMSCEFEPRANDKDHNTPSSPPNVRPHQKASIIDGPRAREISDDIGGFTDEHSISGKQRKRPWWKRLFSWNDKVAERN